MISIILISNNILGEHAGGRGGDWERGNGACVSFADDPCGAEG